MTKGPNIYYVYYKNQLSKNISKLNLKDICLTLIPTVLRVMCEKLFAILRKSP